MTRYIKQAAQISEILQARITKLEDELKDIEDVLKSAHEHNFSYIFTSLHIPENDLSASKDKLLRVVELCKVYNLYLICDVSPRALQLLDIDSFSDLKHLGITHLRPDFGFDVNELVALSKDFTIVLNASTLNKEYFTYLVTAGLDVSKIIACHNFYPKKYTGISEERTRDINSYLHSMGILVIGFVMGDGILRGPIYEGLPTVESMRNNKVFYNALYLNKKLNTDIIVVGDFGISDLSLKQFDDLDNGYIEIEFNLSDGYDSYLSYIHHDRVDNSEFFIRSHESVYKYKISQQIKPYNTVLRRRGDLCVSNEKYLRYNGELEIMLKDLPMDERVNVIGHTDSDLIDFVDYKTGVVIKKIC